MEAAVKVNGKIHGAIKEIAASTGKSAREIAELLISQGLSRADKLGDKMSIDGALLSKVQARLDGIETDHLKLQTRLLKVEEELEELEEEPEEEAEEKKPIELTKDDLLGTKKAVKPGEIKEGQEYYCKGCLDKRGKYVWLDPEEKPETCPECGQKINWSENSGGGTAWLIAGVAALALLSGARRSSI